jgi:hypothetical protein
MRIEGARLVVTCRKCGVSVVAVGWNEEKVPPDDAAPEPSGSEMVGGRLELEEGDEPVRRRSSPQHREYSFDPDVAFENRPVAGPGPKVDPKPEPKPEPKIQPKVDSKVAPARNPIWMAVVASGVVALACALLFFALRTRRTENAPEPKAAESIPAATTAAPPSTQPVVTQAVLPATPAPTPGPRAAAPASARPDPQKPTPKAPAAAPVPATVAPAAGTAPGFMSESQALASGLIDAEEFQDRAGKVMTNILFCRNLELARNPDVSLGALDVSLIVSPSGTVSEVRLDRAAARSSLALCLRDHLGKLQFPSGTERPVEIRRHVDAGATVGRKAP